MKELDELNNILLTLKKYDLPISPILEYSIQEKIESLSISDAKEDDCLKEEDVNLEDFLSQPTDMTIKPLDEEASYSNCAKLIAYFRRLANNILETYPDSRQWAILKKYIHGEKMSNIASEYNLTTERIRQIIQHSMGELSEFKVDSCEIVTKCKNDISVLQSTLEEQDKEIEMLKGRGTNNQQGDFTNLQIGAYTDLISDLYMPKRLRNILMSNNIRTVYELSKLTIPDFFKMKNAGRRSLLDAKDLLKKYGLDFKEA